jgi:hypothetical protein
MPHFRLLSLLILRLALPVAATPLDAYDELLEEHVDADGFVDYAALRQNHEALDRYVQHLGTIDLDAMPEADRLATLINAYNAFMLQMVLHADGEVKHVLNDLDQPFEAERFTLAGRKLSLNGLQNDLIRGEYGEPRIHWAINCGATSCPPMRAEAYRGDRLEAQLAEQAELVHSDERFVRFDGQTLTLTPLYDWYAKDFKKESDSVVPYVSKFVDGLDASDQPTVEFFEYDWTLNDQQLQS